MYVQILSKEYIPLKRVQLKPLPVDVGVALNVPDTISPRLEEEFPLDFLGYIKGLKSHSPDSLKRELEST